MIKLDKNEHKMILINSLFTLASALSCVFVNVFLYAYTGSLVVMTIYTCIKIALYPPFYIISGKIATKKNFGLTLSIGLIIMMIQLAFILFFNNLFAENNNLVYLIATINGIGDGFYWLSICSLNQYVSTPESRNKYFGILGIFNNITSIVAPLLASTILDNSVNDMAGYITIFKVVLVFYIIIAIISFTVKVNSSGEPFTVLDKFNFKDKKWEYVCVTTIFAGLRDAITLTLAGLLVYNATGGSGSIYSKLLAVFALVTIISYSIIVKKMDMNDINKWYKKGCFLIATSTMALVLFPNIYGAIYYGLMNGIAMPMYSNPYNVLYMNLIAEYKNENLVGRVIVRECMMTLGRCGGMIFTVLVYAIFKEPYYLPISVLILSMAPICLYFYHKRVYHTL